VLPALLEHVCAHHQVRVPVPTRVVAVRADAADFGGEVEGQLRSRLRKETLGVRSVGEVEVIPPGDDGVEAFGPEPLDQVRAEEAAAPCDENSHCFKRSRWLQASDKLGCHVNSEPVTGARARPSRTFPGMALLESELRDLLAGARD